MDLYKKIWSPAGEPFEVAPELANELVLNKGWFNVQPVADEPAEIVGDDEAPKPERKPGKPKTPLKD
ncbi:hypothetical protein Cp1R7AA1_222 [Mesorhizobium phage Cp1R7A-A1]|nr:hypothetical protein Cp1R7AA1_222 [Mesorhizobium phage Cp1R7A-A1]